MSTSKYVGQAKDFGGAQLQNIGDASANNHAASWGQVQNLALGLGAKKAVDVATTANVTLASGLANGSTIDGVSLTTGMRVLVKNQTTQTENGIYDVPASGAASRSTDADSDADFANGMLVTVRQGTASGDKVFILDNNTPPTLGSDNITFTSVSSAAGTTYVAGDGLAETGGGTNTFSVNAGSGLEISSDNVRIAAAAAGSGLTGGAGSALAVGAGSGITVNADDVALASSTAGNGLTYTTGVLAVTNSDGSITVGSDTVSLASQVAGNGLTLTAGVLDVVGGAGVTASANAIAVDTSLVMRKYSNASIGDNSATQIDVTHGISGGVTVLYGPTLMDTSTGEIVEADIKVNSSTVVRLNFGSAPTTNQYTLSFGY